MTPRTPSPLPRPAAKTTTQPAPTPAPVQATPALPLPPQYPPGYPPPPLIIVPFTGQTALTYEQSAALMTDMTFRGRIKVAALKLASQINTEAPSTPAHNTRFKWAAMCYQNPEMVASNLQSLVVISPSVQQEGSEIDDNDLQVVVDLAVQTLL